jgi:hypothetical protein
VCSFSAYSKWLIPGHLGDRGPDFRTIRNGAEKFTAFEQGLVRNRRRRPEPATSGRTTPPAYDLRECRWHPPAFGSALLASC